jgi:predicted negative regulator of RcsB-dependent stress response
VNVDLLSEEEQWESLKAWFRANGLSIIALTVVMLGGFYGWKWWQARQGADAVVANAAYEKLLQTFDAGKIDDALAQIETLRSEHPKSAYVSAADLAAAKVFVTRNELDKAALRLERVAKEAADKQLRPIAQLRLARVQLAQGRHDAALATLGTADRGAYQAAYAETRGDVLLARGDKAGALREYEAARKTQPADDQGVAALLDLKINDLRAP